MKYDLKSNKMFKHILYLSISNLHLKEIIQYIGPKIFNEKVKVLNFNYI